MIHDNLQLPCVQPPISALHHIWRAQICAKDAYLAKFRIFWRIFEGAKWGFKLRKNLIFDPIAPLQWKCKTSKWWQEPIYGSINLNFFVCHFLSCIHFSLGMGGNKKFLGLPIMFMLVLVLVVEMSQNLNIQFQVNV